MTPEAVTDCLVIAAGIGSRLASLGPSKPLVPLNGRPLIEWVLLRAAAAGLRSFHVVTGYRADDVRDYLSHTPALNGLRVSFVHNPEWERPNGLSVLAARACLPGPFALLMSDHLFEPAILAGLLDDPAPVDGVLLAVDGRINGNPLVDLDDVTRVKIREGLIEDIGKGITEYDAFDTGIFRCAPALFDALEESGREGDWSLSGGVRRLAARGMARAHDIGAADWVDVDDEAAYRKAAALFPAMR